MAVLNATSGVAVPGAKIDVVTDVDKHGKGIIRTYTCDSNGEAYITYAKNEPLSYRIYTDTERAFPFTPMSGHFHYYGNKADVVRTSLFTDRDRRCMWLPWHTHIIIRCIRESLRLVSR